MAVNLSLFAGAGWQFFTDNGIPLSGGLLYTYTAGSTTPETTYADNGGATQNANPIVLDAAGRPPSEIWLSANTSYKFVVKTSTNTLIRTYDDIPGANDVSYILDELANTSNIAQGDALVGFKQSNPNGALIGAVGKTVHDKLQDLVSIKDFGAVGNGVADDSTAIQNALNSGALVIDGSGLTYRVNTAITIPTDVTLQNINFIAGIAGMNVVLVNNGVTINNCKITGTGTTSIIERGIYVAADGVNNVTLTNIEVTNLTVGIHAQPLSTVAPSNWNINCYIHDIVGTTGASEGYGVLLSPAIGCFIKGSFINIKRHAVYLSAGSSYNDVNVDVNGCEYSAVTIYAVPPQLPCQYNRVRGSFRNISQPSTLFNGSAVDMVQQANYNDVSVRVLGSGNHGYAIWIEGASGGPYPKGNHIHDCEITGTYLAAGIQSQNADSSTIVNNYIEAILGTAAINLAVSGTAPVTYAGYVENNFINGLGTSTNGIINSYEVPYHVGTNKVINNTGFQFNDYSTAKLRTGRLQTITGQVTTAAIAAGATGDTVVTLPQSVSTTNRYIGVQINGGSAGTYTYANQVWAINTSATQITLRVFNGGAISQTFVLFWQVMGD
jgi:hypothetical protein